MRAEGWGRPCPPLKGSVLPVLRDFLRSLPFSPCAPALCKRHVFPKGEQLRACTCSRGALASASCVGGGRGPRAAGEESCRRSQAPGCGLRHTPESPPRPELGKTEWGGQGLLSPCGVCPPPPAPPLPLPPCSSASGFSPGPSDRGVRKVWPTAGCVYKCSLGTQSCRYLHFVHSFFDAVIAELSSWEARLVGCRPSSIYCLALYRKNLLT